MTLPQPDTIGTGVRPVEWWDHEPVPFITARAAEEPPSQQLMRQRGTRLGFTDELWIDRQYGVPWMRMPSSHRGEPQFEVVHGLRQRSAMARMLCQICGGPTPGTNGKRTLFLVGSDGGRPIREGEPAASPPVHAACARLAVEHCPPLRRRWAAALVSHTPVWGVAGVLYDSRTLAEVPAPGGGLHRVPFTDQERLPWILASRLMVTLEGVTPVLDLDDLADDMVDAAAAAP